MKIKQIEVVEAPPQLTISTWQSIHTLPKEWFVNFDFVLGDEAHSFKAKSLSTIMTNLLNSKYRIGCTGTLDGTKTHKLMLEGLFGPVFHTVTTKQLIDKKQLSAFKIKCLILKHPPDVCKRLRDGNYQSEIEYIVSCNPRNQFIKNLTLGLKGNSLVLFQLVEKHGKELYKMIVDSSRDRKVFFVSGSTDVTVREDIRKITDSFPNQDEILFEFNEIKIKCKMNDMVTLADGTKKEAKDISENDDIDSSWIINNTYSTGVIKK